MALPISVTYTFATATSAIPLSQLDANFTTVVNGVNGIGNGTNSLSNVSITGGNLVVTTANATTINATTANISGNETVGGNLTITGGLIPSSSFMRNRIINGAMVIDQRNAGAAVTTSGAYTVDRFANTQSGGGVISWARSTTAPTGFTNSLSGTVTTPDSSIAAGDIYRLYQYIEGFNCADLGFGTASASTVTVSFWVRSSITGTYCLGLQNATFNRSYAANYTINAANTWEYKTVTIAGDTTGTWATDNTAGIAVFWDLGSGTTWNQTANTWAATNTWKTSSQTSWIATNGATFYITGVQLEVGSVATPFEQEIYSTTLAKCQRYLPAFAPAGGGNPYMFAGMVTSLASSTIAWFTCQYPVSVRSPATGLIVSSASHFAAFQPGTGTTNATGVVFSGSTLTGGNFYLSGLSGVTAGDSTLLYFNNASSLIYFTGCEL